jgi:hypothetical protein
MKGHSLGIHVGAGNPGCKAPIITIDAFIFLIYKKSPFSRFFLNNKHWGIPRKKGRFYMLVF